jgi:transposase
MLTAMFCLSESDTFYLYPYPTDMRKSFYSLSGIVTNEMKRNVQDGEAFIFVNRTLTSMKILHAEYGGLVIYNLKLEKGRIGLPDMELGDSSVTHRLTQWHELMLMAQGINPLGVKRSPRWIPQKQMK